MCNTCRQKCCAKGSGKEVKIQEFMYRDTANVEPEIYDHTSNNWSHWDSNEKLNTLQSGDDFSRFFCYTRQCPVATFVVFSRVVL